MTGGTPAVLAPGDQITSFMQQFQVTPALVPIPPAPTGGPSTVGVPPPASTSSSSSSGSSSAPCDWGTILSGIGSGSPASTVAMANCTGDKVNLLFSGFSWGRVAAFVVGLICLVVGLYLFTPTRTIVQPIVTKGKELATAAAAA